MPWKSRWTVDIPSVDLSTYVFPKQTGPLGDKPLIIDAERPEYHLTHTTYRDWCKRFAAGLVKNGFKPGDRLLLFSGNAIFFPVVFHAAIMAGGIFSGANPGYVSRELAYQLQDTGAKFLITADASLDTSLDAAKSIGFPRDRIFTFDAGYDTMDGTGKEIQGIKHWSSLFASPEEGHNFQWKTLSSPADLKRTVCLNYSSGTTGVPKGVEITHGAYVANSTQVIFAAKLLPDEEEWNKIAKYLCFLPMYHAYGQTYFCCTAVVRSVPVYYMQKFDFLKMLQYIERFRITTLTLVPPIAIALAKRPETKKFDLSSVTFAGSGAAPLSLDSAREVETVFPAGQVNVKQGWGMTEVTCSMTGWDPNQLASTGSIGEMNANCEAMIVDENGTDEMPQGERGEFWVRGPNVMKGYWNKPEATRDTLTPDGWLKTGDVAYRDENNMIYIVDRKKELIKVKGNQVAPAELEGLLLTMDEVQDAAVIGVTIKGEEYPRAYLVLKEDRQLKPDDVHKFMDSRVARHKKLVGGVAFVDAIPKNPSGKILRKILREQAVAEIGDTGVREAKL